MRGNLKNPILPYFKLSGWKLVLLIIDDFWVKVWPMNKRENAAMGQGHHTLPGEFKTISGYATIGGKMNVEIGRIDYANLAVLISTVGFRQVSTNNINTIIRVFHVFWWKNIKVRLTILYKILAPKLVLQRTSFISF